MKDKKVMDVVRLGAVAKSHCSQRVETLKLKIIPLKLLKSGFLQLRCIRGDKKKPPAKFEADRVKNEKFSLFTFDSTFATFWVKTNFSTFVESFWLKLSLELLE